MLNMCSKMNIWTSKLYSQCARQSQSFCVRRLYTRRFNCPAGVEIKMESRLAGTYWKMAQNSTSTCLRFLHTNRIYLGNSDGGKSERLDISDEQLTELKKEFGNDKNFKTWLQMMSKDSSKDLDNSSQTPSYERTSTDNVHIEKDMEKYNVEEFYDYHELEFEEAKEDADIALPISLKRGIDGVFDIEEMVQLLRAENGSDICVIKVPSSYDYTDYLVLVTGRSSKHLKAIAHFIKWIYKRKRGNNDAPSCRIEGLNSSDWLAIDLKNIVVHIMLRSTREKYDIETLWTVSPQYDDKLREETEYSDLSSLLMDFIPQVPDEKTLKSNDNLLTLSKDVTYVYDKEEKTATEQKFGSKPSNNDINMENIAGWHK